MNIDTALVTNETHAERLNDLEKVIRAFWRRIEPFKNDYGKELPETIPCEFIVNFQTALTALDMGNHVDGESSFLGAQIENEIDLKGVSGFDLGSLVNRLGYRQVMIDTK